MNLRQARLARSLSLDALAARAGVTAGQIWKLETGRVKQPSLRSKRLLAEALGVAPHEIAWSEIDGVAADGAPAQELATGPAPTVP